MRYSHRKKYCAGASFAEYLVLLGTITSVIFLVTPLIHQAVRKSVAASVDQYIGTDQEPKLISPLRITEGRRLVYQDEVYSVQGANEVYAATTETNTLSKGELGLEIFEAQERKAKGEGENGKLGYEFEDKDKVPFYSPTFVKKEEGYINAPLNEY